MKTLLLGLVLAFSSSIFAQDQPVISVSGSATQKVNADELIINTGIELEGKDAKQLFDQTSATMDKAVKYLKGKKGALTFETDIVRLSKTRNYQTKEVGFLSSVQISIILKDFKLYDEVLNKLIEMGFNNITNIQFSVSNPSAIKEEVRVMAMKAAQKKAQATALVFDVKLSRLKSYREDQPQSFLPQITWSNNLKSDVAVNSEMATLAPGQVTFTTTVYVEYLFDLKPDSH